MEDLIKVEIRLITKDGHPGEWQWMGLLSKKSLKMLTANADTYSDFDTEERNKNL